MGKENLLRLSLVACFAFSLSAVTVARPPMGPGPGGPGGPGFRPGPGFGPGPGPRPGWGPGPRRHHHHWGRDVVGGALAIGLGLGVAGAIANTFTPPVQTYTPPVTTYVPPNYLVPSAPVVVAPPVVTAPVVTSPVVVAPSVSPGKVMYWCQASKNFYPYVTECSSGWQATSMP